MDSYRYHNSLATSLRPIELIDVEVDHMIENNLKMLERSSISPNFRANLGARPRDLRPPVIGHSYHRNRSGELGWMDRFPVQDRSKGMSPEEVMRLYPDYLTPYEKQEIAEYTNIYFLGVDAFRTKVKGIEGATTNFGFDMKDGSYWAVTHDHIAYRYEILRLLGKGSFGQVVKVYDHKKQKLMALKICKNEKKFAKQARKEVEILAQLRNADPENKNNIVHMQSSFMFRGHVCIVFELLSCNLYELIKKNSFMGFTQRLVRNFAHSILICLNSLARSKVIHGDLKPENILLKNEMKSGLKVIDFGSSCHQDNVVFTYVQSRFYRAPEVILGAPYGPGIDMWSLGCILVELLVGCPLLPGEDEQDQMALTMELLGIPPPAVIENSQAKRKDKFFRQNGRPRYCKMSPPTSPGSSPVLEGGIVARRYRGPPGSRRLDRVLVGEHLALARDFISRCLAWDPLERMTPHMALRHVWLRGTKDDHRAR